MDTKPKARKFPIFAALAQGFFCLVMGLWQVFGYDSFARITGHRPDHWLLTLAGLLLAGIGLAMAAAAIRRDIAFEVYALGLITACALGSTDIIFVIERSIPLVYLLDAVAESLFVTLWAFAIRDLRRTRRNAPVLVPSSPPSTAVETSTAPGGIDGTG